MKNLVEEKQLIPYHTSELPEAPWLVIAPHPDDETFGMGGTLLLAKQKKIEVYLIILTDGAWGGSSGSGNVTDIRKKEVSRVSEYLHIKELIFFDEPDRQLNATVELIWRVATLIKKLNPKSIFFPSFTELHPDHRSAATLVWKALKKARFTGTGYAYDTITQGHINRLIDITDVADEKKKIMGFYQSQMSERNYMDVIGALDTARSITLPSHVRKAEGFHANTDFKGSWATRAPVPPEKRFSIRTLLTKFYFQWDQKLDCLLSQE